MIGRQLPESAYQRLKAATRRLVRAAGGVEHAVTRVGKSTLSDYCNLQSPSFAPIDVIADLEDQVGEPIVSNALAQIAEEGKIPTRSTECDPVAQGAAVMAQLGRFTDEALKAIADGKVDDAELKRLLRESEQLRVRADELYAHLSRVESDRRSA